MTLYNCLNSSDKFWLPPSIAVYAVVVMEQNITRRPLGRACALCHIFTLLAFNSHTPRLHTKQPFIPGYSLQWFSHEGSVC